MKLQCTKCAGEFYGRECPVCGGAGREAKGLEWHIWLGLFAIVALLSAGIYSWAKNWKADPHQPEPVAVGLSAEGRAIVDGWIQRGLVRFEGQTRVFVKPDLWLVLDATQKKNATWAFAQYQAQQGIRVFDDHSARQLAECSPFGFSVK